MNVSSSSSLSHRRRPNHINQGIDLPPSLIMNRKKKDFQLLIDLVPLQRLCVLSTELEGSSTCCQQQPIIIIFGQCFVVTLSFRGVLKFYQLNSSESWWTTMENNHNHNNNNDNMSFMRILPKWKITILHQVSPSSSSSSSSRIVSMTSVETMDNPNLLGYIMLASDDGNVFVVKLRSEHDEPELVYSLSTELWNVISMTSWIQENDIHVIVGTQGGIMEERKLTASDDGDWTNEIIWKGSFHTSLHSILAVGGTIMACISQKSVMEQTLQFTTVEVLNRKTLLLHWKEQGNDGILPLTEYCLWPEQGREWVRTSEKRHDLVLGSNVMFKIDPKTWAAALDDGSIGILDSSIMLDSDGGSWGLLSENHHVTLAYPAIALGKIEMMGKWYLTCCLRGGTVYCIPIENDNVGRQYKIPTFLPPSGDDEDYGFLHGFVSGNVRLYDQDGRLGSTRPVIIYEGAGGVLEVYICGLLLQSDEQVSNQIIIEKMMQNGSIKLLLDAFRSMKEGDELLNDNLWVEAREECLREDMDVHDIVKNRSNLFKATRALLLSLSG
jgi:hypothetical protein